MKKILYISLSVSFIFAIFKFYIPILAKNKNQKIAKEVNEIQKKSSEYKVKEHIKPKDLDGISNQQIDDHWKLYEGYVKQVNKLNQELSDLRIEGKGGDLNYADRRRRFGFEYNGMILHEYYFGNLCANQEMQLSENFVSTITEVFGSFEKWKEDFKNTGKTRGIGWAILYLDPNTENLINVFVQDHEVGNITSFVPLLVMDVWEHAYMVDYFAGERGNYIDAFLKNINWSVVEKRFTKATTKNKF